MDKKKGKENYSGFLKNRNLQNEFVGETDRAAVIIGGAALDVHLEKLLENFLISDTAEVNRLINSSDSNAPLGTFSAKIRAAYCLGLISKNDFEDLQTVRKIRNIFAHNLTDCDFSQQRIKDRVDNFIMLKQLIAKHPSHNQMKYRDRFTIMVYSLDESIRNKIEKN